MLPFSFLFYLTKLFFCYPLGVPLVLSEERSSTQMGVQCVPTGLLPQDVRMEMRQIVKLERPWDAAIK